MSIMVEEKKPEKDPPVRKDGTCARTECKNERRPDTFAAGIKYAAFQDPFCSTECCRIYWHCPLEPARKITSVHG